MNFIQQKLAEQQKNKGKNFKDNKKQVGKLPKPSKNFKPMRAK
jgi:hypothetical protein